MCKRLSVFIILCLLVSLFAACSGSSTAPNSDPASQSAESSSSEAAPASNEPPTKLSIIFQGEADAAELQKVNEAMNALTVPALNITVEITRIGLGSYDDQLSLMLSSGEDLDLFNMRRLNTLALAGNGQIRPLTELINTYGQEMYNEISQEDWVCCLVNGEIMVVPSNKDKAYEVCILMDKAICDELDIPYGRKATLDEIHDQLVKVKEAYPDMYPLVTDAGQMFSYLGNDVLGDNFGVILDIYKDDLIVENLYSSSLFYDMCERMYNWAQEGLIMPDGSSNTETSVSLIKAGKGFARLNHRKPGYEQERTQINGKPMVTLTYGDPFTMTDAVSTTYGWAIPHSSKNPEKAMQLLNMLYTTPELANIMCNGVEGEHWVYTDENKTNIRYPEGKNSTTAGYSRVTFNQPNQQITIPWEGDPVDIWEQMDQFNRTAHASPAKGFIYNNNAVLNEVAACTNVHKKYWNALICGSLNPAEAIPQLLAEMEANGLDTIIAEKQRQLDEWAAANK